MASDTFDLAKVSRDSGAAGGDTLFVRSGGAITIETGGQITGSRIERKMISRLLTSATALTTVVPDATVQSFELPATVKSVRFVSNANIAGHATSNATITLNVLSSGATATTAIASLAFTTANAVTAYVPKTLTLTTSLAVAAGETLVQKYSFASSGLDVPIGVLTVDFNIDSV